MIMVHGRNASPNNILDFVPALQHPDFTYLAPAAAGNTWYPLSFMAEIERNEPGITSGIEVIHELIALALAQGVAAERILLLGFSQGGCLALTAAYRRGIPLGGVVGLSGGLIGPPGTQWPSNGTLKGMTVFLGCSDVDSHIPRARVGETAEVFRGLDADVTERIYPGMGHTVNEDEIAFVRDLMDRVAR